MVLLIFCSISLYAVCPLLAKLLNRQIVVMVGQVSFDTSGDGKILVHLANFSISKLYVSIMDVRQFV